MNKIVQICHHYFNNIHRKNILYLIFFLWILFHIITIQRSPLVWFDEAFFAFGKFINTNNNIILFD